MGTRDMLMSGNPTAIHCHTQKASQNCDIREALKIVSTINNFVLIIKIFFFICH